MGFSDWVVETKEEIRQEGIRSGVAEAAYEFYRGSWRVLGSRAPVGTNVFEREWDLLIVLDACRVDLLREYRGTYPFLSDFDTIRSVGSHSREWLAKTFRPAYARSIAETAYVTGNVFTEHTFTDGGQVAARCSPFRPDSWRSVDAWDFAILREVWREAWNDEHGTVLPEEVTDRAIDVSRIWNPGRLIVHYMQPHLPFVAGRERIGDAPGENGVVFEEMNLQRFREGAVSRAEFVRGCRANIARVLEGFAALLDNVDAERTVITADHGEAFGEWDIYGHPIGFLHPVVKIVPWIETSAGDSATYDPEVEAEKRAESLESRLEAIGYAD